ncbi:MAG: hypothetical protein CL920_22775 [Deltaproteobacteria bacterium]|nr:hypothetical protein [Deltaproteobacteria bacterium]
MSKDGKSQEHAEALTMAMEDVRRIREVLDDVRGDSAVRAVLRPSLVLGFFLAPIIILYGVFAQWLFDSEGVLLWEWHRKTWLWVFSSAMIVSTGLIKWTVLSIASWNQGFTGFSVWRKILLELRYYRVTTIAIGLLVTLSVYCVHIGHVESIVGMVVLVSGAICFLIPLVLPLDEMTPVGLAMFVVGVVCLFYWPAYPFYKVAAVYGGTCIWIGLVGLRISPNKEEPHTNG